MKTDSIIDSMESRPIQPGGLFWGTTPGCEYLLFISAVSEETVTYHAVVGWRGGTQAYIEHKNILLSDKWERLADRYE